MIEVKVITDETEKRLAAVMLYASSRYVTKQLNINLKMMLDAYVVSGHTFIIARYGGKPAGYAVVSPRANGAELLERVRILRLCTLKEHKRKGVATAIVRMVENTYGVYDAATEYKESVMFFRSLGLFETKVKRPNCKQTKLTYREEGIKKKNEIVFSNSKVSPDTPSHWSVSLNPDAVDELMKEGLIAEIIEYDQLLAKTGLRKLFF